MNLKQRGLTVGDLLVILIFVISTIFIIDKVKDSDNQAAFIKGQNQTLAAEKY